MCACMKKINDKHDYNHMSLWYYGIECIRLQRWSIFDGDAMPMFFFLQRCDVDGFGHFLPSQSVRLFLVSYRDRLFSDGFSNLRTDVWR